MRNDLLNLAAELVEHHLPSPRLEHTLAVGYRARHLAERLRLPEEEVHHLEVAGVLHSIGYGVDLVDTGHHAFDGGIFLQQHGLLNQFARTCAVTPQPMRKAWCATFQHQTFRTRAPYDIVFCLSRTSPPVQQDNNWPSVNAYATSVHDTDRRSRLSRH